MPKDSVKDKLDGNDLDLSLSSLTVVPVKEITALGPRVTNIDLSCNLLPSLPTEFCSLINLVKLDLSKNHLVSLPDKFGELHRLQYLDLFRNKLTTVPVSFFRLKNLKWMDLRDNPLCEQMRSVAGDCLNETECKNCAKRVVAFMRNVQADQERKRQKRLEEERELEAARKVEEEKERQRRKAEKLLEKERKRQEYKAKQAMQEAPNSNTRDNGAISDKADAVKNGTPVRVEKQEPVGLSCCGVFLLSFITLALVVALSFYYCNTHPKDALCHDVTKIIRPYYLAVKRTVDQYIAPR